MVLGIPIMIVIKAISSQFPRMVWLNSLLSERTRKSLRRRARPAEVPRDGATESEFALPDVTPVRH
jgi:hypothetical protein